MTTSTRSRESTSRSFQVEAAVAASAPGTLISVSSARMASRRSCSVGMVWLMGGGPLGGGWGTLRAQGAVDREGRAVDVRRLVGGEEGHGGGDLLGPPDAAGGDRARQAAVELGRHVGLDDAGGHGVARDAALGHLARDRAREAEQPRLGGDVVRLARVRALG